MAYHKAFVFIIPKEQGIESNGFLVNKKDRLSKHKNVFIPVT